MAKGTILLQAHYSQQKLELVVNESLGSQLQNSFSPHPAVIKNKIIHNGIKGNLSPDCSHLRFPDGGTSSRVPLCLQESVEDPSTLRAPPSINTSNTLKCLTSTYYALLP